MTAAILPPGTYYAVTRAAIGLPRCQLGDTRLPYLPSVILAGRACRFPDAHASVCGLSRSAKVAITMSLNPGFHRRLIDSGLIVRG